MYSWTDSAVRYPFIGHPDTRLSIRIYRPTLLQALLGRNSVAWNRAGHTRLIPYQMLLDRVNAYNNHRIIERRSGLKVPASVEFIDWEDTQPIQS